MTEIGADYLVYEAFDDSAGVDTFTYRVRDRLGKEATATDPRRHRAVAEG